MYTHTHVFMCIHIKAVYLPYNAAAVKDLLANKLYSAY